MIYQLKEKRIYIAIVVILIAILIIGFFVWQPKKQTVVSDDGKVSLEIPRGALPKGVSLKDISITKISPEKITGVVAAYRLEPDGLEFQKPATISLSMDIEKEPMPDGQGNSVRLVQLFHLSGDSFKPLENQKGVADLGSDKMTVQAPIQGFSSIYGRTIFHPHVGFSVYNERELVVSYGEETAVSESKAEFFVGDTFYANVSVWHKAEIRIINEEVDKMDEFLLPFTTLIERGSISDLKISGGLLEAPTKYPVISPGLVKDVPYEEIIEPGVKKRVASQDFKCEKAGGDQYDIVQYGKSFGHSAFMEWEARFAYTWRENWYTDYIPKELYGKQEPKKILMHQYDNSLDASWLFLIPVSCLPRPAVQDKGTAPPPAQPSVSKPEKTPEPPSAPPLPSDPNEARCAAVCGKNRYSPATSQQACSDTSKDFLCIQNKQSCYDYLIPKGWQNDSNCCCKDEPVARSAGSRINCAKFVGWDINGFAVEKNPKYPFSSATLSPAECR